VQAILAETGGGMSYEGYTELLCSKGHKWSRDAYSTFCQDQRCSVCGSEEVFRHEVDQTNGIELDENGIPFPHTVPHPFEETGWEDRWQEDHYGNTYAVKIPLYKIPTTQTIRTDGV
jgi:hypothetical protein